MSTLNRDNYLTDMMLAGSDKREARIRALNRAHEIRKFEIELLWKRALFFWGFQAAILVAIATIFGAEDAPHSEFFYPPLSALGFLTALGLVMVNKGSKFWQETWEFHIDMLEEEFEGRVHQLHLKNTDDCEKIVSVSKVSEHVSLIFFWSWLIIFLLSLVALVSVEGNGSIIKACQCSNVLNYFWAGIVFFLAVFATYCLCKWTGGRSEKDKSIKKSERHVTYK